MVKHLSEDSKYEKYGVLRPLFYGETAVVTWSKNLT